MGGKSKSKSNGQRKSHS